MNFNDLLKAFQPVQKIAVHERRVFVGGTPIGLRVLNNEQEGALTSIATSHMAEYSKRLMEGDLSDISTFLNVGSSFNRELDVLQYAIFSVGDVDFTHIGEVDTGEKLPSGNPVVIPKHEAIRQILGSYPDSILKMLYSHYQVLHEESVTAVESAIVNPSADLKVEIDRLTARLDKLQADYAVMQTSLRERLGVTELLKKIEQEEEPILLTDPRFEETSPVVVVDISAGTSSSVVVEDGPSSFGSAEDAIDAENRRLYLARRGSRKN